MVEGGGTVGRTVCRGEEHAPLPSSTATDPGAGISPSTGSWRRSLHRSSAPARNSNSGASNAVVLSRLAGLPGVSALSESKMAKYYQLQRVPRDANACAVVVITARWTKLRRTSGDLKDLDKVGIDLETSSAVMALAPLLVDCFTGAHGDPQLSQQGWLAQPFPTTLSPFGPTSYCL